MTTDSLVALLEEHAVLGRQPTPERRPAQGLYERARLTEGEIAALVKHDALVSDVADAATQKALWAAVEWLADEVGRGETRLLAAGVRFRETLQAAGVERPASLPRRR